MTVEFPVLNLRLWATDDQERSEEMTKIVNDRLMTFQFIDRIEANSEVKLTLSNQDLFFLQPPPANFVEKPRPIPDLGTIVEFQFGYLNEGGSAIKGRPLTPKRSYAITGFEGANPKTITYKAISPTVKAMAAMTQGQVFRGRKVSDIVRDIAASFGFDAFHRVIQDTKHQVDNLVLAKGETILGFLYRLARPINFVFYETEDENGARIFHFHKKGWSPPISNRLDFAALQERRDVGRVTSDVNESELGSPGSGYTAPLQGVLHYNNVVPEKSRVKDFNFRYDNDGVPLQVESLGVDITQGNIIERNLLSRGDLDIESLAPFTDYDFDKLPSLTKALENFEIGKPTPLKRSEGENLENTFVTAFTNNNTGQQVIRAFYDPGLQKRDAGQDEAKAQLEKAQEQTVSGSLVAVGNEKIFAGDLWAVTGVGIFEGVYLVRQVTHTFKAPGGYEVSLDDITTDGVRDPRKTKSSGGGRDPRLENYVDARFNPKTGGREVLIQRDGEGDNE